MTTHGGWYAGQAKQNPDLFRAVFDFNRRPQHWVHPAVLQTLPHAEVVTSLAGSYHGAGHLAGWLLRQLKLADIEACWDFEEPRRRLFLLSHATLERLARFCGATLHWPRIAAAIGRAEIAEIKGTLGEDAHSFALRRGRMLVPETETAPPTTGISTAQQCLQTGWQLIATALTGDEDAMRRRWWLKLPPGAAGTLPTTAQPELRERAWQRVRRISPHVLTEGELKCFA